MKKLDILLLTIAILLIGSYAAQFLPIGRYVDKQPVEIGNTDPDRLNILWEQVSKNDEVKTVFVTDKSSVNDYYLTPLVTWPEYFVSDSIK